MKTLFYVMSRVFIALFALITIPIAWVFFFSEGWSTKLMIGGFYGAVLGVLILIECYAAARRKKIHQLVDQEKATGFAPNIEIDSAFSNRYIGIDSNMGRILYIDDDLNQKQTLQHASILSWEIERDGNHPLITIFLNNKQLPFLKIRVHKKDKDRHLSNFMSAF